jgi:hypothetical protein
MTRVCRIMLAVLIVMVAIPLLAVSTGLALLGNGLIWLATMITPAQNLILDNPHASAQSSSPVSRGSHIRP